MTSAGWSIPVCLARPLALVVGRSDHRVDLKPANLLLMASNVDEVVMRELFVQPGALYDYPKVLQPKDIPIPPPISAPLFHAAPNESPPLYWVIADFGHGTLARC